MAFYDFYDQLLQTAFAARDVNNNNNEPRYTKPRHQPTGRAAAVHKEMEKRARNGSATARAHLDAQRLNTRAVQLLVAAERKPVQAAALLRQSLRLSSSLAVSADELTRHQPLLRLAKTAFERLGDTCADAMLLRAVMVDAGEPRQLGLAHALNCVRLYPDDAEHVYALATWHLRCGDYESARKCVRRAVELAETSGARSAPPEWLFQLAEVTLETVAAPDMLGEEDGDGELLCEARLREAIATYSQCVELSAADACHVPHACYTLAMVYADTGEMRLAEQFYKRGVEAERVRLPCFERLCDDYEPKTAARGGARARRSFARRASVRRQTRCLAEAGAIRRHLSPGV